jgi:hypothetical protein
MSKTRDLPPRQRYRAMCGELDQAGIVIYINRIKEKHFEFQINGEIKRKYKKRESCNRQIVKLYNQNF